MFNYHCHYLLDNPCIDISCNNDVAILENIHPTQKLGCGVDDIDQLSSIWAI